MGASLGKRDRAITLRMNIIRMRRNYPDRTRREIGERFGVTRERTRQVLVAAGKPTKGYHPRPLCLQCEKEVRGKVSMFCSRECFHNYTYTLIPCSRCGEPSGEVNIKGLNWQIDHGNHTANLFFCSKECQGKWLGETHGFIKYPENRKSENRPRKWDWSKVYELRDRHSWGVVLISRALSIPEGTVSRILRKGKVSDN